MSAKVQELLNFIASMGGRYSEWYVGIATDPQVRLFDQHRVSKMAGQWIYIPCESSEVARLVEAHFIGLGTMGGSGGGDYATKFVYAYRITPYTIQTA